MEKKKNTCVKKQKRSLDANAYCWLLCGKIADVLSQDGVAYTKEDVYRHEIHEAGIYRNFPNFNREDAETFRTAWGMLGTGWLTELIENPGSELVTVRCWYGSSAYNRKQMSRLIDNLVQDCRNLGISTDTPEQIANLLSLWKNSGIMNFEKNQTCVTVRDFD